MTGDFVDPYLLPGADVLRNKLGVRDRTTLDRLEYRLTWARRQQLENAPIRGNFDLPHLQAIHKHLFQDLFDWAGQLRTVDITKGSSVFHPASLMHEAARHTFGWLQGSHLLAGPRVDDDTFVTEAAELLGYLNYMHPFREGNGRTQRAFMDQVAARSGRVLSWRNVSKDDNTRASIDAFDTATSAPFEHVMAKIILPARDGLSLLDDNLYQSHPATAVSPGRLHIGWAQSPMFDADRCGAPTTKGSPCLRRGACPFHGGRR
ncbi:MAG: Fic family protein [Propionibacteriaceae bacterium]|nr:Fic family protein [Propionibacteriaceae bacterium]